MRNTLEERKSFSVIKWAAIVGFVALGYLVVTYIFDRADTLGTNRSHTEEALDRDLRYGEIKY